MLPLPLPPPVLPKPDREPPELERESHPTGLSGCPVCCPVCCPVFRSTARSLRLPGLLPSLPRPISDFPNVRAKDNRKKPFNPRPRTSNGRTEPTETQPPQRAAPSGLPDWPVSAQSLCNNKPENNGGTRAGRQRKTRNTKRATRPPTDQATKAADSAAGSLTVSSKTARTNPMTTKWRR